MDLTHHVALMTGDLVELRGAMDVHLWGTLDVVREFAPVLKANGGGAIVNVLSVLAWFSAPGAGGYAAAKAAEWSMTNGIRNELADQGTSVQGVHLGAANTDMMAGQDGAMVEPRDVARASLDGLLAGALEVLVDEPATIVKAALSQDPAAPYGPFLRD